MFFSGTSSPGIEPGFPLTGWCNEPCAAGLYCCVQGLGVGWLLYFVVGKFISFPSTIYVVCVRRVRDWPCLLVGGAVVSGAAGKLFLYTASLGVL